MGPGAERTYLIPARTFTGGPHRGPAVLLLRPALTAGRRASRQGRDIAQFAQDKGNLPDRGGGVSFRRSGRGMSSNAACANPPTEKARPPTTAGSCGAQVRTRLSAGGKRIRTCMGFFLSSGCFWFIASSLFGAGRAVLRPVACDPGSRSARKGSRDRNASKACFRSALTPEHAEGQ